MTKTTVICNKCGKEIDKMDLECNPFSLYHNFGYGSDYDTLVLNIDLCSSCQDSITTYLIKNCKINPIAEYYCKGDYYYGFRR